jgi:hypothetical protein
VLPSLDNDVVLGVQNLLELFDHTGDPCDAAIGARLRGVLNKVTPGPLMALDGAVYLAPGTDVTTEFQALIDARTPIRLGDGTYRTTAPLRSTGGIATDIYGLGSETTIIHGDHDGPVLDFSEMGWSGGASTNVNYNFVGFRIEGNQTDSANRGIYIAPKNDVQYPAGLRFVDVVIRNTGGECVYADRIFFAKWIDCVFHEPPTGAAYAKFLSCNGSQLIRPLFRGWGHTGAPGVLQIIDADDTFTTDGFRVIDAITENCEALADSQIILIQGGHDVLIRDWKSYDDGGSLDNCYYARFLPPTAQGAAANSNRWEGPIPGDGDGVWTAGMFVGSSRNSFIGQKGWKGKNIVLDTGVEYNSVILAGQESQTAGATQPAVIDNSGNDRNTVIDMTGGTIASTGVDV